MHRTRTRGIGKRIRARLRALGYWKDGRPDVLRFCLEKGYPPQNMYTWLKGRVPMSENLMRLGMHLAVSPAWLLFGESPPDGWAAAEIRQTIRPTWDYTQATGRSRRGGHNPGDGLCQA